jgi:hypothetical protein
MPYSVVHTGTVSSIPELCRPYRDRVVGAIAALVWSARESARESARARERSKIPRAVRGWGKSDGSRMRFRDFSDL